MFQNQPTIPTIGFLRLPQVLAIFPSAKAHGGKDAEQAATQSPSNSAPAQLSGEPKTSRHSLRT